MNDINKIIKITRPYWPYLFGGIVFSLLVSGITAAIAWVVKPALDQILVEQQYEYIKFVPVGVVLLFTLKGIFNFAHRYLMCSAGISLVRDTRNRLYAHMLGLPMGYFNRESSGVIISRTINDVDKLEMLITDVIKVIFMQVPTIIFLLGVAFYRKWDLTLIVLLLVPVIALSTRKFGKRVKKKRKEALRRIAIVTHKIGEAALGMRIIRIFNREDMMNIKFCDANRLFARDTLKAIKLTELTKLVIDFVTGIGVAFAIWYGITMVMKGIVTPGDLASIIVAIYMVFTPVKKLGNAYNVLQESRASMERIDTLLEARNEKVGNIEKDVFTGSLRFENVSFSYQERATLVLKDINFEINNGEVLAIVGQSGSGKSTLVDLIPNFNRPNKGKITIDGMDINEIALPSLRELIGIVSQDVILFDDTIRENIAFGKKNSGEGEIIEASRLANADEFIRELPQQYDTEIGERGVRLSGGQRQRIAIARAILKNPPILILDEATSSLDSVSEAIVQKALEKLMKGRTTIIIAHRLSTILNADRILVLDEGRIIDSGSHEELMKKCPTYIKLYNTFSYAGSV